MSFCLNRAVLGVAVLLFSAFGAHAAGDGVVVTLWGRAPALDYVRCNQAAQALGARSVSYLVHLSQPDAETSEVSWRFESVAVGFERAWQRPILEQAIRDAHRRGLEVVLVPFLWVESGAKRHGIRPRDRARWFASYGRRIESLARFAAREGVAELLIGSELSSMYGHATQWRALAARVRSVFGGHITVSVLFWEYPRVRFWDALDSVGVSAYFPLAPPGRLFASLPLLRAAWRFHRVLLLRYARAEGKPITFCEVGYPATEVAASRPWDYAWRRRRLDVALQARCFEALRQVWGQESRLRRFSIWGFEAPGYDARVRGGRGFDPSGKPAEAVVRRLFRERAALGSGPR